jgi:hypothetical protein
MSNLRISHIWEAEQPLLQIAFTQAELNWNPYSKFITVLIIED